MAGNPKKGPFFRGFRGSRGPPKMAIFGGSPGPDPKVSCRWLKWGSQKPGFGGPKPGFLGVPGTRKKGPFSGVRAENGLFSRENRGPETRKKGPFFGISGGTPRKWGVGTPIFGGPFPKETPYLLAENDPHFRAPQIHRLWPFGGFWGVQPPIFVTRFWAIFPRKSTIRGRFSARKMGGFPGAPGAGPGTPGRYRSHASRSPERLFPRGAAEDPAGWTGQGRGREL